MHVRTHVALLMAVMVGGLGVMVTAQGAKKPRAFFVEPKNNATVTSPAKLKFGSEGIQIAAVPDGDVKTARPGIGHYHVGVDVDCVAPAATIVKGTPSWVHFGKGDKEIDMQLSPGKHKLSLQVVSSRQRPENRKCTRLSISTRRWSRQPGRESRQFPQRCSTAAASSPLSLFTTRFPSFGPNTGPGSRNMLKNSTSIYQGYRKSHSVKL